MAEHTQGPWRWDSGSVFSEPHVGHAYTVAISPRYQKPKQWEADARLIAAAPDLLAYARLMKANGDPDAAELVAKATGREGA
jgi:hypothetical protein